MIHYNTKEYNEQIRVLMNEFTEQIVTFYNTLHRKPVGSPVEENTWEHLESQEIPREGRPLEEVYSEMLEDIYAHVLLAQHPRSFSCVPSNASLLSWMGDAMTAAYNPHASCRTNAPAADLVEKRLIRWMCDRAGYPEEAGGLFVSGGSMANLTALTAARDARLSFEERSRAVVYVSDQTHVSAAKGLHIIGFDWSQVRMIPTDDRFRMDLKALKTEVEKDRKEGKKPFAVIASAGTTNTGSVDPMKGIAAICREYGMWMHVDGAFGASALLSETYRPLLEGIEESDSLSWDAHKWMMQTYSCSVVLVRDKSDLVRSFAAHPEYLKDAESSEEQVEFWDLGPELTRPARGLKLWLTLQTVGSKGMEEVFDHGCALAELAEERIRQEPEWEIMAPASLGVVNFRYAPDCVQSEAERDRMNQEISYAITESGFAQVFTTILDGKKVLRMCTINPDTTKEDICNTIDRCMDIAAALKARTAQQKKPSRCA